MADGDFLGGVGSFFQGILGRFGGGTPAQPGQALLISKEDKVKEYLLNTANYYQANGNTDLATALTTMANEPTFITHLVHQHPQGAADGLLLTPVMNPDGTPQTDGDPPHPVYAFDLHAVVKAAASYKNTTGDAQARINTAGASITTLSTNNNLPGGKAFHGEDPMYLLSNAAAPSTSSIGAGLINASPMLIAGVMAIKEAFTGEGDFFENILKGLFMLVIGAIISLFMTMGGIGNKIMGAIGNGAEAVAVDGAAPAVSVGAPNLAMAPPAANDPSLLAQRLSKVLQTNAVVTGDQITIAAANAADADKFRAALNDIITARGEPAFATGTGQTITFSQADAARLAALLESAPQTVRDKLIASLPRGVDPAAAATHLGNEMRTTATVAGDQITITAANAADADKFRAKLNDITTARGEPAFATGTGQTITMSPADAERLATLVGAAPAALQDSLRDLLPRPATPPVAVATTFDVPDAPTLTRLNLRWVDDVVDPTTDDTDATRPVQAAKNEFRLTSFKIGPLDPVTGTYQLTDIKVRDNAENNYFLMDIAGATPAPVTLTAAQVADLKGGDAAKRDVVLNALSTQMQSRNVIAMWAEDFAPGKIEVPPPAGGPGPLPPPTIIPTAGHWL